jgi:HK97 family phage major capsid protein
MGFADDLKALRQKGTATKSQQVTKAPRTAGQSTMARLQHGAPAVRVGRPTDAGVVPLQKAMAYAARLIDEDDADIREAVDLSNRIKGVYGAFYEFSNTPYSLIVPASLTHIPTTARNGCPIPGAGEVAKECRQRILAVQGLDPDEIRHKAATGDRYAQKALNTLSDLAGGSTVPPPTLGDLVDLQRNREVFSSLGATNVTLPPSGRMDFPKLTGGATAYWVGETASITESQQTTGSLKLEVKKLAVRVPLTNELMRFSDTSIDAMVRTDMAAQGGLAADLAMLQGTGGTQIKGLITYESQAAWSQGSDKLIAHTVTSNKVQPEDVVSMLAKLPDRVKATGWVMRPDLYAVLRNRRAGTAAVGDGGGPFVFDITRSAETGIDPWEGLLSNVPVVTSRQVSNTRPTGARTYVIVGHFPDWLIGRLGFVEFMVDPYTQMQNYQTVIQAVQFIDAGPRHPASFVFADEIDVS